MAELDVLLATVSAAPPAERLGFRDALAAHGLEPFLLRLDPATMAALRGWASDDLRSLNGQIECLLRRALRDAGRLPAPRERRESAGPAIDDGDAATNNARDGSDAAAVAVMQGRGDRR